MKIVFYSGTRSMRWMHASGFNVKLNKLCREGDQTPDACVSCYCRPMWCVECMAKW